ncbi:NF-kappa-B inhibitor cactus-like isoform X2 [Lineus longissimus]|uniref:NF-kappa-B inhibitor cactus-like isoform X2 n=1 Tax=Lineus longissimus TaxID=88925 RepID=UPI00315D714B
MDPNLPSDVTADAACDTGSFALRRWATYYESVGSSSENDSGIQSLGKGVQDLYIDITRFDNKRRGKRGGDTKETPKRQCYDSGVGDSLKAAVSLGSKHGDVSIGAFSRLRGSQNINKENIGHGGIDEGFESIIREKAEENDIAVLFARNAEGDTPLHIFIIHELLKAIVCIIGFACSPCQLDIVNDMQQSPLILAAMTRQARVVRALLIAGADLLLPDRHGNSALHIASRNGDLQTLEALAKPVSLREAQDGKYVQKTRKIEQEVKAKNYDGYSPIHLATLEGHLDILTHLVEIGADVDEMEGKAGLRPIHLAVANEDRETIKHLVEECLVDIDATTFYGLSPIELANERGLYDVVVYLANFGAYRTVIEVPEFTDLDEQSDEEIESEFADLQINGQSVFKI